MIGGPRGQQLLLALFALVMSYFAVVRCYPGAWVDPTPVTGSVNLFNFSCPAGDYIDMIYASTVNDDVTLAMRINRLTVGCSTGVRVPASAASGVCGYQSALMCKSYTSISGSFNRTCPTGNQKTAPCLTSLTMNCQQTQSAGSIFRNESFSFSCPAGQVLTGITGKQYSSLIQYYDIGFVCGVPNATLIAPQRQLMGAYYLNTQWYSGPKLYQLDLSQLDFIVYAFFWYDQYGNLFGPDQYPISQYYNNTVTDAACACCVQGDVGQFMALKRTKFPQLQVYLGLGPVGGWGAQETANVLGTKVLTNATATAVAVNQTVQTILDWGFDGVDFDWEWPANTANATAGTAMIAAIKAKLAVLNPTYTYHWTVTIGSSNLWTNPFPTFDYMMMMTYQYNVNVNGLMLFEQQLYQGTNQPALSYQSMVMDGWVTNQIACSNNLPKSKMMFGISPKFYMWYNTNSSSVPFTRPPSNGGYWVDAWNNWYTYYVNRMVPSPGTGMNYAYIPERQYLVLSPDPVSAAYKQDYIKAKGIAGNFLFHLGQDVICKTLPFWPFWTLFDEEATASNTTLSYIASMGSKWSSKSQYASNTSDLITPSNLCSPLSKYCNIRCGATCSQLNTTSFCSSGTNTVLTFYGGPTAQTTAVLTQLNTLGLKAIFFLDPNAVAVSANQATVQRIFQAGHTIGHFISNAVNGTSFTSIMNQADSQIQALTGLIPSLVRLGYNLTDTAVCSGIASRGYTVISATLPAGDTGCYGSGTAGTCMANNVTTYIQNRSPMRAYITEFSSLSFVGSGAIPASSISNVVNAIVAKTGAMVSPTRCLPGQLFYSSISAPPTCDRTKIPYDGIRPGCASLLFSGGISLQSNLNLQALRNASARATFFVAGATVISNTQTTILNGLIAAGMQIGHSGYTYADMSQMNANTTAITLLRNDKTLASLFQQATPSTLAGLTPTSLFPPYGFNSDVCSQAQALGYNITQYDVNFDASANDPVGTFAMAVDALIARGVTSPIVAISDTDTRVTQYIPQIVQTLTNRSIAVNTLSTCLNDNAPYRSGSCFFLACNFTVTDEEDKANVPCNNATGTYVVPNTQVTCNQVTSSTLDCAANLIKQSCVTSRTLALTFTGGPDFNFVNLVRNVAAANLSATFFVQGSQMQIPFFGSMIQLAMQLGHFIGSGTYDFLPLVNMTATQVNYEMQQADYFIQDQINLRPNYIRPPQGVYDDVSCYTMQSSAHSMITWAAVMNDTSNVNATDLLSSFDYTVFKMSSPQAASAIVAANPAYPYTVDIFAQMVTIAASYGYSFTTLPTCLGDNAGDAYRNATWTCGDGHCYPAQENCTTCATDCGACPSRNLFANAAESNTDFTDNFFASKQKYVLAVLIGAAGVAILVKAISLPVMSLVHGADKAVAISAAGVSST